MVNPRKAYPIDPGLIPLYERTGRAHRGRALETAIMLEPERRQYSVDYLRTEEGWEVAFLAERPGEVPLLVQVCLDTVVGSTFEREVRSLEAASGAFPRARALLITMDSSPPARDLPGNVQWMSAARWLLEMEE